MSALELEDTLLARVAARVGEPAPNPDEDGTAERARKSAQGTWTLPGIASQTRVSTNFGEVPAHLIRVRDKLRTREGRYLPVLRIEEYKLDDEFLKLRPEARPVSLSAPAGTRSERRERIILSPAQPVAAPSDSDRNQCARADTMSRERVAIDRSLGRISYFVFDLGEPEMIRCEGVWVRSASDVM